MSAKPTQHEDARDWMLAISRSVTDNGERTSLDDVLASFGISREKLSSPPQDVPSAVSPPTCDCQPSTGTYCDVGGRLVDMAATAQTEAAETGNLIPLNITVSALTIHWGYERNEVLLVLLNRPWGLL